MDSYSGYKLKSSSYPIQPNDIIIRVIGGSPKMPNGQIAIALSGGEVKTYTQQSWTTVCYHWRAIETKPGAEAKVGDTVYCIKDTGGACQIHDSFIVNSTTKNYLSPIDNHKLLNGTFTDSFWGWWSENFVVLVKAEEKKQIQNIVSPEDAKPGDYVIWDESASIRSMTRGKAYEVFRVYDDTLAVRNNEGRSDLWSKSRFKNIDKEPIEFKVNISKDPYGHIQYISDVMNYRGLDKPIDSFAPYMYINTETKTFTLSHDKVKFANSQLKLKEISSINDKDYTEIASVINSAPLDLVTTVSIDSIMNKPTQTKQNSKEKQMNPNLFTDILKLLAQAEQTDLQKAPSTYAFFYNNEGKYEGTARVANETEAKALLQKPEHLGYTMRIYSFSDEFTTQIPVVSTIKKTVKPEIYKSPKAIRKPRASKAN